MYTKMERRVVLVLVCLAGLFLTWQVITVRLSADYDQMAGFIRITGRQASLSQRMAKDAALLRSDLELNMRDYYVVELKRTLETMEKEYQQLVEDNHSLQVRSILEEFGPIRHAFLTAAQEMLEYYQDIESGDIDQLAKARLDVLIYEDDVIAYLDAVLNQYMWETAEIFRWIQRTQAIFISLIMVSGFFLITYVLVPIRHMVKDWYLEAKENNANMLKIFHIMRNAMFMLSRDGTIVMCNANAEDLLRRINLNATTQHIRTVFDKSSISWENIQAEDTLEKGCIREVTFENEEPIIMEVSMSTGVYQRQEAILLNLYDVTEQKKVEATLTNLVARDKLTGLYNRYHLENYITTEIEEAERYDSNLSMLTVDLDHFKLVNDRWGHPIGDQVLKHTAHLLVEACRKSDVVFRLGGEEFMIVLPQTEIDGAMEVAEKVRSSIEKSIHPIVGKYTVSVGVAQRKPGETFRNIYQRADDALYAAKSSGRNCVKVAKSN